MTKLWRWTTRIYLLHHRSKMFRTLFKGYERDTKPLGVVNCRRPQASTHHLPRTQLPVRSEPYMH
jgi:hypothetical protein